MAFTSCRSISTVSVIIFLLEESYFNSNKEITAMLICITETALSQVFMLWIKVEERSSERIGRKDKQRSVTFIRGNMNVFPMHFLIQSYFQFSFSFIRN